MRITLVIIWFVSTISVAAEEERGNAWDLGFDVSVLSDDNLTRGHAPGHVRKDSATQIKLDVRYDLDFSINRALIFTGHLLDESYQDFDGVSNKQAGLEAEYRFRTHTGFGAPVYSFFINHTQADYETDIRDGDTLEYGLRLSRQYTDRIALTFGAAQSERTADGRVFDLEQTRYFAQLNYRVPNRFQTYLAYYSIDGDVYFSSPVAPAVYGDNYSYDAVELDPAFSGINPWWAYRVDARTDVLRLGFSISINGRNSIDVSMDDIGSKTSNSVIDDSSGPPVYGGGGGGGGGSLSYDTKIMSVSYFHRF